ncbi:hypothetical protein TWF225_004984 [Orbilia oligospora]|uniref:Uncharacterized protein n=1 Tax=Orbilia oligospora TaxID=2813651 RepID=A0A7C8KAG0_ORBOL|nr:hypothetical protein TWF751_011094 [Orbilia oligospora]KAF3186013.1 hypothetical protein TWF225_004984 [Orbilia oligospora]KAF3241889.1 hypothetical protein TWF217_011924 [Orbilia oligospora]KAF3262637.1 hypothetical protein TWF128_002397 [Orbilia oligospora]KAF3295876.1 hypothetical protein TWF132_000424 [Orbilia oligospora]
MLFSPPGPATATAAAVGMTRGTAGFLRSRWGTAAAVLTRPRVLTTTTTSTTTTLTSTTRSRRTIATSTDYTANVRLYGSLPSRSSSLRQRPISLPRVVASRRHVFSLGTPPPRAESDPSPGPLPLPDFGPNEPKRKVLYSYVEERARKAPSPDPVKGTWQWYRWKIFTISGPEYAEKTPWTWFKWHFIGSGKVVIFVGFTLVNLYLFYWGWATWSIERESPTPKIFTEWARTCMQIMHYYAHWYPDLPIAALWGRDALNSLEKQMEKAGGWDKCSPEWQKHYVNLLFKVAGLCQQVAKDEDAYISYRRMVAMDAGLVDATRRSRSYLGMGTAATAMGNIEEGTELFQQAVKFALEATPESERPPLDVTKPVLPDPKNRVPPSLDLIEAVQAVGVQYARLEKPAESLPIFLSLLRTLQALPEEQRDICREGYIMAYVGEVVWALDKKQDGLKWTKKALLEAEKGWDTRNSCKECAIYAVANAITMTRELGVVKGKTREDLDTEISALKGRQNWLNKLSRRERD